jgi:hypothetical protein
MANESPLSGLTDAAGGYILPFEQGEILTAGILQEAGALQLAADSRATSVRKEVFSIWQGKPTAEFVGEAGTKPVTGAEFSPGTLNIKKVATIVTFTDEMLEDVQSGDLNVLVDGGIRAAIADTIDSDAIKGSNFDSQFNATASSVAMGTGQDALATAVSAAMGSLEAHGYKDFGVLVPADYPRHLRDARASGVSGGGTAAPTVTALPQGLYQPLGDPLYGKPYAMSTNLDTFSAGGTVAYVVSRPNLHVRIRRDVVVKPSTEATIGGTSLYQQDLTGLRYVTRLGLYIHDLDNAVVQITK